MAEELNQAIRSGADFEKENGKWKIKMYSFVVKERQRNRKGKTKKGVWEIKFRER